MSILKNGSPHSSSVKELKDASKVILLTFVVLCAFVAFSHISIAQQVDSSYLVRIELEDADEDADVPDSIRSHFDDNDNSPLKCAPFDLNADGIKERFIPNEFLCGSGGCPWILYDVKLKQVVGVFELAKVIFVQKKRSEGYCTLECYVRNGGGEGSVIFYEMKKGQYVQTGRYDLHDEQIENYFNDRRGVPSLWPNRH
jgi:hypothetical protein